MSTQNSCYIGVGSGGCNIIESVFIDTAEKYILFDKTIEFSTIPKNCNEINIVCTLGGVFGSEGLITLVKQFSEDKKINIVVTVPISFEGKSRSDLAKGTIEKLQSMKINFKIIDNNELLAEDNTILSMKAAFGNIDKKIKYLLLGK